MTVILTRWSLRTHPPRPSRLNMLPMQPGQDQVLRQDSLHAVSRSSPRSVQMGGDAMRLEQIEIALTKSATRT